MKTKRNMVIRGVTNLVTRIGTNRVNNLRAKTRTITIREKGISKHPGIPGNRLLRRSILLCQPARSAGRTIQENADKELPCVISVEKKDTTPRIVLLGFPTIIVRIEIEIRGHT